MTEAAPDTPAEKSSPSEKSKAAPAAGPLLLGVAAVGLVVGGLVGTVFIAPPLIAARDKSAAAHADPAHEEAAEPEGGHGGGHDGGHGGGHGKGKHGAAKSAVYRIDNIIVNPAGSQGSRFLMATVAFEARDPKVESRLREHDVKVRDAVTATLESQSMEMLGRPGARDSLRRKLATVVAPFTGGARVEVYLPQLVIQ
jgi:flagellar FliL protein